MWSTARSAVGSWWRKCQRRNAHCTHLAAATWSATEAGTWSYCCTAAGVRRSPRSNSAPASSSPNPDQLVGGKLSWPVARRGCAREPRSVTDERAFAPRLPEIIECRCCRSPLNVSRRPPAAAPGRIECRRELSRASIVASSVASAAATGAPSLPPPVSPCELPSETRLATRLESRDAWLRSSASSASDISASRSPLRSLLRSLLRPARRSEGELLALLARVLLAREMRALRSPSLSPPTPLAPPPPPAPPGFSWRMLAERCTSSTWLGFG